MKARNTILTITAVALIATAGIVFAQQGPGECDGSGPHGPRGDAGSFGGPGGPGGHGILRMLPRLADKLDLTEDQQSQIQAIVEAGRTEIEPLRDQAISARDAFRDAHGLGDFDEVEYRSHFEAQAQLHVEMQLIGARSVAQVWEILTPDQQQELMELIELFRSRGGPRQGGGKRHGAR